METIIRSPAISTETRKVGRASAAATPAPEPAPVIATQPAASQPTAPVDQSAQQVLTQKPEPRDTREEDLRRLRAELQQQYEKQYESDAAKLREDAQSRGYADGVVQGKEAAGRAVAEQVERLAAVTASLAEARAAVIDGAEDVLVEIVFSAVCQIIGDTATTREGVASLVNHMVGGFKDHENLTVRFHPQDLETAQRILADSDDIRIDPKIILRADTSVSKGGCIVDTATGSLDARLDVQLERLRETLVYVRRRKDLPEERR